MFYSDVYQYNGASLLQDNYKDGVQIKENYFFCSFCFITGLRNTVMMCLTMFYISKGLQNLCQ